MKVVFIPHEPYERASSRVRAYNFAERLSLLGYDAEVIGISDLKSLEGKECYHLSDYRKVKYNSELFDRLSGMRDALFYVQKIGWQAPAAYLSRYVNGNRLIVDYDDWDFGYQPFRLMRFVPFLPLTRWTSFLFNHADAVVTASYHLQQEAVRITSKPVYLIPTGTDTDRFKPGGKKNESGPLRFVWIGLVWGPPALANIKIILEAFAGMRNREYCRLELAGRFFGYEVRLKEIIARRGLENFVTLKEWIRPEDVPAWLSEADAGLFYISEDTDYNRSKSPTKLFEYMACGLPTVSGRVGEIFRVIDDGEDGFTAACAEEMREKMDLLASDAGLRERMGTAAREKAVRKYSLRALGEELVGIIEETAKNG